MEGKTAYIKCGQVMETLVREGAALLARHGEDAETAERGGKEFAYCVMTHFSGQKVYFPKFTIDAARKRLKAISDDVQGTRQSASEVAKKLGISLPVAYQIVKQTIDLANGGRLIDSVEAAAFSEGPLKSVNELAFQIFRHSKEMGKPIEHSDALELARRLQNKIVLTPEERRQTKL